MQGILGIRDGVLKTSGKSHPSARDFVTFSGRGQVHDAMVGGPKEIADRLEEMFVERGCDGFVIAATYVPGSYADFVQHIVPELQRRGLFQKDYRGRTLRAFGVMWRTTNTVGAHVFGIAAKRRLRAVSPPADAPMVMMSRLSMEPEQTGRRCVARPPE